MGVLLSQMTDLLAVQTANEPVDEVFWTLPYQNYDFFGNCFGKDKIELTGGTSIQRQTVLDETGQASHVYPMERLSANVHQIMDKMRADWVLAQSSWVLTKDEDNLNQTGSDLRSWTKALLKLRKVRRTASLLSLAKELAQRAWLVPSSATDSKTPLGIPYAVPRLAQGEAADAAGFYGGRYDTAMGANTFGIPPATSDDNKAAIAGGKDKWRSYQAAYAEINTTFFNTLELAMMLTNFKSPILNGETLTPSTTESRRMYVSAKTSVAISSWVRANNDSIGPDSGAFAGRNHWKGIPFMHEPQLDVNTSGPGQYNPIYGINHDQWKCFVQQDDYFTEDGPHIDQETPRMAVYYIFLKYAYLCMNRREQFCINTVA